MKASIFLIVGLFCSVVLPVHATSYGRMGHANITSVDNKLAICLPNNAKEAFSVGWITLSESYVRKAGVWALALKSGAKPLVLKPGGCIVYGSVPDGYELESYGANERPLKFEVNKTYVFRLTDAYHTTDTYEAAFCIGENSNGFRVYLQYTPLPGGGEVVPPCDAKRNENIPEQVVPTNE